MSQLKKIILIPNQKKDTELTLTRRVVEKLLSLGIAVWCNAESAELAAMGVQRYSNPPTDADAVVVIGGDGSVIDASEVSLALDIPLLGINLGKVGYLGALDEEELDLLDRLRDGDYQIEEKLLLCAGKVGTDGSLVMCEHKAVNDVVVSHDNYFGISDFVLENSRGDKVKYRADGIIVSTPVGSTAYSLSVGGPIVSHTLDSIAVTPICPHSFFDRTIIYGSGEEIIISNVGENSLNISVDGRYFSKLDTSEACVVYKSNKKFKTIVFSENNMFSVLFKKIKLLDDKI